MALNSYGKPLIIDLTDEDQDDFDGFDFVVGDEVQIIVSGEVGVIIGRSEWMDRADTYTVRYESAGVAVEREWAGNALKLRNLQ